MDDSSCGWSALLCYDITFSLAPVFRWRLSLQLRNKMLWLSCHAEKLWWLRKTQVALIEKLAASGGFASWFQSGVPAERRRRQLPIGSASLLWGDGWACHAPSPCRCNWGFSCCGTTRFVFPRREKQRVAFCKCWKAQSFGGIFSYLHTLWIKLINIEWNISRTKKKKKNSKTRKKSKNTLSKLTKHSTTDPNEEATQPM